MALAAAVLVLGTIGFSDQKHFGFADSVYNSIQLFGFGGKLPQHVEWPLQIARFLGPLLVGYAAIRGIWILFREQMQLLWFRLILRDHVVIAGLGEMGRNVAIRLNDLGAQVVAIESSTASESIPAVRDRGIGVLPGNARDQVTLKRARIASAAYLIVSCGHDHVDIDIAMAARKIPRRRGILTAFLNIGDPALWRTIKAPAISEVGRRAVRLEPFSLLDSSASLMVEEAQPLAPAGGDATVLIAADSFFGQLLALHVARVWTNADPSPDSSLRIEILGPNAAQDRVQLLGRHPELPSVCTLIGTDSDFESQALAELAADASSAFVAYADEARGLATALALNTGAKRRDVPVHLAVRDEFGGVSEAGRLDGLRVFGMFTRALGEEFLDRGMNEVMARASHEEYLRARNELGESADQNPSLVPWEALPESLRQSNRRQVDGIGPKLSLIDCAVVPEPLARLGEATFRFTDEELEQLAMVEHDRWQRDLNDEGWRYTDEEKDPRLLRHPSLISWDQLSTDEKQKDRDAVLAIPTILSRAGYRIERLSGASTPKSGVRVSTVDPPLIGT